MATFKYFETKNRLFLDYQLLYLQINSVNSVFIADQIGFTWAVYLIDTMNLVIFMFKCFPFIQKSVYYFLIYRNLFCNLNHISLYLANYYYYNYSNYPVSCVYYFLIYLNLLYNLNHISLYLVNYYYYNYSNYPVNYFYSQNNLYLLFN